MARIATGEETLLLAGWAALGLMTILAIVAARIERNVSAGLALQFEAEDLAQRLLEENERTKAARSAVESEVARREEVESAARAQQRRLDLMISRTPVACVGWGIDFIITSWNPAAQRIFGFTADEVIARVAFDVFAPPDVGPQVERGWYAYLAGRGAVPDGLLKGKKSGGRVLCEWFNTPLLDEHGAVVEIVSLVVDVTARRAADAALARARDRLDLALEASAVALGDWHVPSDRWHVDERFRAMLGASGSSLTSVGALRAISHPDELAVVQTLIGDLLDGCCQTYRAQQRLRLGSGEWLWVETVGRVVERDAAGAAVRVTGTIADISAHKAAKGLRLHYSVATDVPAAVLGGAMRLRQVITNLLGNAIKFTAAGEISVRLAGGKRPIRAMASRLV